MKIERLELRLLKLPLVHFFETSFGRITDKPEAISELVLDDMGRGVTAWQGKGMFTEQNHTVLFITISRAQVISLQRLVHLADPDAFIVIGQGHVAYGEGFKRIKG